MRCGGAAPSRSADASGACPVSFGVLAIECIRHLEPAINSKTQNRAELELFLGVYSLVAVESTDPTPSRFHPVLPMCIPKQALDEMLPGMQPPCPWKTLPLRRQQVPLKLSDASSSSQDSSRFGSSPQVEFGALLSPELVFVGSQR